MDPATLTLLAMLSAGAFACLAILYVSIPYPPPHDVDLPLASTAEPMFVPDAEGALCDEHFSIAA